MTILTVLMAVLFAQQPRPASSIAGVVVKIGTSEPVAKAVVELTRSGSEPVATATGSDGTFEFRNLAPGQYKVGVSRTGYLNGAYGQRGPNGAGTTVTLAPGQVINDLRISLIPSGAISGRVYDDTGDPLANVSVRAFKY